MTFLTNTVYPFNQLVANIIATLVSTSLSTVFVLNNNFRVYCRGRLLPCICDCYTVFILHSSLRVRLLHNPETLNYSLDGPLVSSLLITFAVNPLIPGGGI